MTSKLQRMIDLEVESYIHGEDFALPIKQQNELDTLRKEIETKLGEKFTEHLREYE